jgi:F-box-like
VISIDMLPDDVLLEIFDFYVDEAWNQHEDEDEAMKAWQSLVHVCRRWRCVVFGSPRRLNLRLVCTRNTRARDTVDIWPALPLLIRGYDSTDNIVALLEHSDLVHRISQISLSISHSHLEDIWEAMQVPFPELTHLILYQSDETALPLSDSFLGGSAPRLRYLFLDRIPYPGLSKLLLSATHLTDLRLYGIPDSGYIPPEAMAACLSTLTSLERLYLFRFPAPLPDQKRQRPPPSIRTSLPVLDHFMFRGGGEYLEVLVARIDAPRLRDLDITFFNDIIFVTPQLTRFISRTPTLEAVDEATVTLKDSSASVELSSAYACLGVRVSCRELDWQLSFVEQVCTSSLPPLSTLQNLYMMSSRPWPQDWKDNIDYAQWLELLRSFSAVKNLYLSKELAPCVVSALQELVGGGTSEVFPTLENIFVEELQESGPVHEGIGKFVAARQVTSHPVTVSRWDRAD